MESLDIYLFSFCITWNHCINNLFCIYENSCCFTFAPSTQNKWFRLSATIPMMNCESSPRSCAKRLSGPCQIWAMVSANSVWKFDWKVSRDFRVYEIQSIRNIQLKGNNNIWKFKSQSVLREAGIDDSKLFVEYVCWKKFKT